MIHNCTIRKRKEQPKNRYLGVLLLLCYITLLLSGCGNKQESAPALQEPVKVKLDTETAKIDTLYNMDVFDASVVPYTEGISSENEFIINNIKVGIGDRVKKGQVLISMDRTAFTEAYEAMKEEIDFASQNNLYTNEQIEGDIKIAQLELEQLRKSGQEKDVKRKELAVEELKLQYNYAKELQQLELEEKHRKLLKLEEKVNYPDILAPYDGTIIYMTKVQKGDVLQPFNPVVYIADESRLSIQSDYISESIIENGIRIYAMIDGNELDLTNVPYTDEEYKYRLFNKLPLESSFVLKDTKMSLKSGAYACICIISNYLENVLTLPKKAIYKDGQVTYVYKIVDGVRVRQEVEVGRSNKLKTQIISGLKEGDEVYVQQ